VQCDAAPSLCEFRLSSVLNGAAEHSVAEMVDKHIRFVRACGGQIGTFTGYRIGIDQFRRKRVTFALGRSRRTNTTDLEGRTQDEVAEHFGTTCRTLHTFDCLECHPQPSVLSLSPAAGSKTHVYKIIVWTEAFFI